MSGYWLRVHSAVDDHTFGLRVAGGVVVWAPTSVGEFLGMAETDVRKTCDAKGLTVEDVP